MKVLLIFCLGLMLAFTVSAQTISFPGLSAQHRKHLATAKKFAQFPLPTWLPAGFAVEKVEMKLGPRVKRFEKELSIVYSRVVASGKKQRFAIRCGFEGLGDLPYEANHTVASGVGTLDLFYGKAENDIPPVEVSATHWHNVGRTPFIYDGMAGDEQDPAYVMITLADTKKILGSLKRY